MLVEQCCDAGGTCHPDIILSLSPLFSAPPSPLPQACLSLSTGALASVSSPLLPGAPSADLRSSLAVGNLPSLASARNGTAIRYFAVFGRAMCLEGLQKYSANSGWLKVCQPGL